MRRLLRYLEDRGFDAAPRFLGVDEEGRDVLSFVDGFVAPDLDVARWKLEQIEAAFALLRRFHDLTAGSLLTDAAEVVCHNDFTPQNVVFREGSPVAILDWEFAAPGSRRRDLGHGLWQWLNIGPDGPPITTQAELIHRALNAYGLPVDNRILKEIEAREVEWLELAKNAAQASEPTFGRTPTHWGEAGAWVERELQWLQLHGSRLASAIRRVHS